MEEVEGRADGIGVRGSWLGTDSSVRASAVRCTAGRLGERFGQRRCLRWGSGRRGRVVRDRAWCVDGSGSWVARWSRDECRGGDEGTPGHRADQDPLRDDKCADDSGLRGAGNRGCSARRRAMDRARKSHPRPQPRSTPLCAQTRSSTARRRAPIPRDRAAELPPPSSIRVIFMVPLRRSIAQRSTPRTRAELAGAATSPFPGERRRRLRFRAAKSLRARRARRRCAARREAHRAHHRAVRDVASNREAAPASRPAILKGARRCHRDRRSAPREIVGAGVSHSRLRGPPLRRGKLSRVHARPERLGRQR